MKKKIFILLAVVVLLSGCGTSAQDIVEEPAEEITTVEDTTAAIDLSMYETPDQGDVEVVLDNSSHVDGLNVFVDIKTNLPVGTEYMISILTDGNLSSQSKGTVKESHMIAPVMKVKEYGKYTLTFSTVFMKLQSEEVKDRLGENGEHLTGKYVVKDDITGENIVKASFDLK